jgi:hypothetical protein
MNYTRSFMLFQSTSADFSRFFGSAGALESLALTRTAEVDSREEHGQLRRLEFDTVLGNLFGQLEGARLESFVPDRQPVAVKIEDLDSIPAAVEEEEKMAGQRVLVKAFLDQSGEAVEAFAKVRGPGTEENSHGGGELREHQLAPLGEPSSRPAAAIAAWSKEGSITPLSRSTQALASSISNWVPAPGSRIDTGTKFEAAAPAVLVR